jgi:hypothetical protein
MQGIQKLAADLKASHWDPPPPDRLDSLDERTMSQEITKISPSSSWAARGVDGPIRPAANITIDPLDDGARSRVTFALDFEGHGIGKPLVPAVRR